MSLKALFAAATGMDAQQSRVETIANNLANINTTGFKSSRLSFEDLVYDQVQSPGLKTEGNTQSPTGIQIGHGTKLVSVYKHFTQGELTQTNRELDIAIEGNGFLAVTLESGEKAYTRDANLQLDKDGNIVNGNGYKIEPTITVPTDATSLRIGKDGTVSISVASEPAPQELGKLELAIFQNPAGLQAIGQNLFKETEASGAAVTATPGEAGAGTFAQGFLENSNVNVAEELINMIIAQRTYEANSKVLQTTNQMMQAANSAV